MASGKKRLVDDPGFVVEISPSLAESDARRILKELEKDFGKSEPWEGSFSTTYESSADMEVLVTLKMRKDQTVLITMGKPRKRPPPPPPRTRSFKLPAGFVRLGTLGQLKGSIKLLPAPKKASKKKRKG